LPVTAQTRAMTAPIVERRRYGAPDCEKLGILA
jgi:hypothetical protein